MNNLFHLDLGEALPGLVWMIILVIWFVGKAFKAASGGKGGKKAEPRSPSAPPPVRPRKTEAADELRKFLEALSGQEPPSPEEEGQSVQPVAPMPPPVTPAMPVRPRVQPVKREPTKHAGVLSSLATGEFAPAMEGLPATRAGSYQPTQIPGMKSLLIGLNSLRMAGSTMPSPAQSSSAPRHIHPGLDNRATLRRAMIQRIVLGPPVALGGAQAGPDLPEY